MPTTNSTEPARLEAEVIHDPVDGFVAVVYVEDSGYWGVQTDDDMAASIDAEPLIGSAVLIGVDEARATADDLNGVSR